MTASLEPVMPAQYGLETYKPSKSLRRLYLPFMLLPALACVVLATQRIAANNGEVEIVMNRINLLEVYYDV
jgi:hypothetical protein